MISPDRITVLDDVLSLASQKLPEKLWVFFKACDQKGFSRLESLALTQTLLGSLLAVQNPEEFPKTPA